MLLAALGYFSILRVAGIAIVVVAWLIGAGYVSRFVSRQTRRIWHGETTFQAAWQGWSYTGAFAAASAWVFSFGWPSGVIGIARYALLFLVPLLVTAPWLSASRATKRRRGFQLALATGALVCIAYAPFDSYEEMTFGDGVTLYKTYSRWSGRASWCSFLASDGYVEGPLDADGDRHGRWRLTLKDGGTEFVYFHHGEKVTKSRWYELEGE